MPDDFKYDVFLSHSAKDKAVVRDIAERLRADGLHVWFDDWEIHPGDGRQAKIEDGLEQSRVLVLCMSANAFGFDWEQLEAGTFRFRDHLNKERRFLPLRLDEAPIKGSLAQFPYINWLPIRRKEHAKLLEACRPPATPSAAREQKAGKRIQLSKGGVYAYVFSPDGRRALTSARDQTLRLWELETRYCLRVLEGHTNEVNSVAWSADQLHALSGSDDKTVRLWDVESGRCLRVFEGHKGQVWNVAWSADRGRFLSGGSDKTVRLWDVESGCCLRVFEGHIAGVWSVKWSADQRYALSGSIDKTVRVWDVETGRCLLILEGHTGSVRSVAWIPERHCALSGSDDMTVRLWDLEAGRCLHVLQGHTGKVESVMWSTDLCLALSGGGDKAVRLWDLETGRCLHVLQGHKSKVESVAWNADLRRLFSGDRGGGICVWNQSELFTETQASEASIQALSPALDQVQYTNAKVLLVGESGAGKTGLTERLAHNTFIPSYSTSGTWSTQWQMKDLPLETGLEREIWLWDFGGQADQRLIHQLYLDKTALVLLVFNADRAAVLPGLQEWQQALSRSVPNKTPTYLVAGRIDVSLRFDRERVRAFADRNGYRYFETSANNGCGCLELRQAIQADIPWTQLERRTSPTTWKLLNNEILTLRDEGLVLFTFKELRETLRQRLAVEAKFTDTDLETVVGLLDGPGIVKELSFGTHILLRPEWINVYAQAVIRTLRAEAKSLGCLPVQSIAAGKLIFQSQQASGEIVEEKRLGTREERIVLSAMEEVLLERRLCLRQEGNLVFPSYCGLEKPTGPVPPKYFISYVFGGFLDDIYATLVVKLAYCGAFRLKELWRDAADFETLADQRTMGIKLLRNEDGQGTLLVHFSRDVTPQEQVIFANYIHEHLVEKATEPPRQRHFVCPHCDTPVSNRDVAMRKLAEFGKDARIICVNCEQHMPLWDALEERFASDETKRQVAALQTKERFELDARRKGKLLALEVAARITSADQKCFEIPGVEDEGLDLEVEFTDDNGRGTGKRIFLQLKAGDSYLQRRKHDGAEIFRIKKQAWVDYWMKQECPVLLVIGTFPDERDEFRKGSQERFADIRWMEISDFLRRESNDGTQPVKQIVFKGEILDTLSVRRWRDRALAKV